MAKDLILSPSPKTYVESNRDEVNQPLPFSFTIQSQARPGVASVAVPASLSYRFVLSPSASPDDMVYAESGRLHTAVTPSISGNVFDWTGEW